MKCVLVGFCFKNILVLISNMVNIHRHNLLDQKALWVLNDVFTCIKGP